MNKAIVTAIILFAAGNILAWFQANSQFLWEWWYDRPILTVFLYAIPTSMAFFFGWRYAVEATDSLWSARMLGFGIGTIIFATISYLLKGEGITYKTAVCLLLSTIIILIQVLWKD